MTSLEFDFVNQNFACQDDFISNIGKGDKYFESINRNGLEKNISVQLSKNFIKN